jgi:hypothetical protein
MLITIVQPSNSAISLGHHRGAPGMLITRRSATAAITAAVALTPIKDHAETVTLNAHLKATYRRL